eukprot:gene10237-13770_t
MSVICDYSISSITNVVCFKVYLSKLLGYSILLGSIALKLPQIINIIVSKDVVGISPISFYGEVPLATTTVVYNILKNNPFSSYGESVMVLIQNLVLVFLLWTFSKPAVLLQTRLSVLLGFVVIAIISYFIPPSFQFLLPLFNFGLMIISRVSQVPQIISNFKLRTTGQISIITTLLLFVGALVRIFTTIQEVGYDVPLLTGFSISTILSGILLAQIIVYNWIIPDKSKKEKFVEKKNKKSD